MKIETQQVGTVEVIKPIGTLVEDDATVFAQRLKRRLSTSNARVVLDLYEVPYVDSTALEALLDAAEQMEQRTSRLRLVSVAPTVREVLELTGLSKRMQFFEQVQDAVRSFL